MMTTLPDPHSTKTTPKISIQGNVSTRNGVTY